MSGVTTLHRHTLNGGHLQAQGSFRMPTNAELEGPTGCGRASRSKNIEKIEKYQAVCNRHGFSFKPLVFESSGYLHKDFREFLKSIAQNASEVKKIPHDTLYNYFLKKLSMTMQTSFAQNVIKSTFLLCGNATRQDTYGTNDALAMAAGQMAH